MASSQRPWALRISSTTSRAAPLPPPRRVTKWQMAASSGAPSATQTARPERGQAGCQAGRRRGTQLLLLSLRLGARTLQRLVSSWPGRDRRRGTRILLSPPLRGRSAAGDETVCMPGVFPQNPGVHLGVEVLHLCADRLCATDAVEEMRQTLRQDRVPSTSMRKSLILRARQVRAMPSWREQCQTYLNLIAVECAKSQVPA